MQDDQPLRPVAGQHVLVADDDDFFRIALSGILREKHGIGHVTQASTFTQACDALAANAYLKAAFFDLDMPGMNGIEQLRGLRSEHPSIKVAVVSGSMTKAAIIRALECGLHGYVWKMSGPHEVSRAIEIVLGGDIYVPSALADLPSEDASRPAATARLDDLTPRQAEVLGLLTGGASNREIASRLGLGEGTIKIHVSGLLRALGVGRRSDAAELGKTLLERRQP